MKVIVAGPRDLLLSEEEVAEALDASGFEVSEIFEGGATGVDSSAAWYARQRGVPYKSFCADWTKHGKAAGPIRNREMSKYADALVVIRDRGRITRGTSHMEGEARSAGLSVYVHEVERYGGIRRHTPDSLRSDRDCGAAITDPGDDGSGWR